MNREMIDISYGLPGEPTYMEMTLAKEAADTLLKHYPGHAWMTTVENGMLYVRNASLSTRFGYALKVKDLDPASRDKAFVKAGGEILERYNLARSRLDADTWMDMPRTFDGHIAGDLTGRKR